jgi:hypothetical protein
MILVLVLEELLPPFALHRSENLTSMGNILSVEFAVRHSNLNVILFAQVDDFNRDVSGQVIPKQQLLSLQALALVYEDVLHPLNEIKIFIPAGWCSMLPRGFLALELGLVQYTT